MKLAGGWDAVPVRVRGHDPQRQHRSDPHSVSAHLRLGHRPGPFTECVTLDAFDDHSVPVLAFSSYDGFADPYAFDDAGLGCGADDAQETPTRVLDRRPSVGAPDHGAGPTPYWAKPMGSSKRLATRLE